MFREFISITHEMSLYLCSLKLSLTRFMGGNSVVIQLRYFVHIFERERDVLDIFSSFEMNGCGLTDCFLTNGLLLLRDLFL